MFIMQSSLYFTKIKQFICSLPTLSEKKKKKKNVSEVSKNSFVKIFS